MASTATPYDYLFKLLLIGDSGVGKTTLLQAFVPPACVVQSPSPTIGVDFREKRLNVLDKKLKLMIWDTAGQERFRTLIQSYYRGAQGIIMVYDVTRKESFDNLSTWLYEINSYSTNEHCILMLVGNKVDKDSERVVPKKQGQNFAQENGCLFIECSATTDLNVKQCFNELVLKILDNATLIENCSYDAHHKKDFLNVVPPPSGTYRNSCC